MKLRSHTVVRPERRGLGLTYVHLRDRDSRASVYSWPTRRLPKSRVLFAEYRQWRLRVFQKLIVAISRLLRLGYFLVQTSSLLSSDLRLTQCLLRLSRPGLSARPYQVLARAQKSAWLVAINLEIILWLQSSWTRTSTNTRKIICSAIIGMDNGHDNAIHHHHHPGQQHASTSEEAAVAAEETKRVRMANMTPDVIRTLSEIAGAHDPDNTLLSSSRWILSSNDSIVIRDLHVPYYI